MVRGREVSYMELAGMYVRKIEGTVEESTLAKYEEMIYGALKNTFGEKMLNEITVEEVRGYVQDRSRYRARLRQEMSVLSMMLTFAVNGHMMEKNPCEQVAVPKRWRKEIAVLRDENINELERDYMEHRYGLLILFMVYTGLRIGEALALRWENVDWGRRTVRIHSQVEHHYDIHQGRTVRSFKSRTKNGVDAEIYLCDQAMEVLEKAGERGWSETWVFTEPDGAEIVYSKFYYEFNKIMKAIGRADVTPHSLRHTTATTIMYCTRDTLKLRNYLRHRGAETSVQYVAASEHEQRELAKAIEDKFITYIQKRKERSRDYDDYKIYAAWKLLGEAAGYHTGAL